MEIGFYEEDGWILPKEGTWGNKAVNLHSNDAAIKEAGLKVPKSLVIPFEYLQAADDHLTFAHEQIDEYFPGWLRILVRSNAPDEDMNFRFPGQYASEDLWHRDRDYSLKLIEDVLESYNKPSAKLRRGQLGLGELGMSLLIQEPVSNTPGDFDANYSGAFSDIGQLALLAFTDPTQGLDAMQKPSVKKYWVDMGGLIQEEHSEQEEVLAERLRRLTDSLPHIEGKGWEIEFVGNNDGTYVVQTTPIFKSDRVIVPDDIESIFDTMAVVGTDEVSTEGILYVPPTPDLDELVKFDSTHSNYCLVTTHHNIALGNSINILEYLTNPTAILDIKDFFPDGHPYAPHIEQYMREGRIALAGTFNNELGHTLVDDFAYFRLIREYDEQLQGIIYSPTRLVVKADEISQKGVVALADGKIHDFVPISQLS